MRNVTYKQLSGQNFLSIGHESVNIDLTVGLHHITGKNLDNPDRKNAVGKSVIADLLYYALYGSTIRNINKAFILNNTTKGSGDIQLTFDVETELGINSYKIKRTLKPSKVEITNITINGDVDITNDSISNTNNFIMDLVGTNPTITRSCDILSLSDNNPFMAKKPEDKRKFIEDIFSMEIFGKMLKDLKNQISENTKLLSSENTRYKEICNTVDTLTNRYNIQKKINDDRHIIMESKKKEIDSKITELQTKLSGIDLSPCDDAVEENKKISDVLVKVDKKIEDIRSNVLKSKATLSNLSETLSKYESVGGAKCDKCLQDIPHSHKDLINSIIEKTQEESRDVGNFIRESSLEYKKWTDKRILAQKKMVINSNRISELDINKRDYDNLNVRIADLDASKSKLDEVSIQSDDLEAFLLDISESNDRKMKSSELIDSYVSEGVVLDSCKFILGEEGVKSFIIKKLLTILNVTIQDYITKLGMTNRCKFDEYFDEVITNDKGSPMSYWNLSGAERKTIDIACAWAFKDIRKKISGTSNNIEIIDELFDNAVDTVGFEKLMDVLKERISKNKISCYVISHRTELTKHISGETIDLIMENKVTKRLKQ